MGFMKAFELGFAGVLMLIILFSFLSATIPIAQSTIDNASAGVFGMGEATKTILGLLGFIFAAVLVYAAVKEALTPDDQTRINYGGGFP